MAPYSIKIVLKRYWCRVDSADSKISRRILGLSLGGAVEKLCHVVMMCPHVVLLPARYWCQVDSADSEIHSGNFVVPESLKCSRDLKIRKTKIQRDNFKTVGLLLTVLAGGDLQHLVANYRVPRALAAAAGVRLAAASRCMKYHVESHRTLCWYQRVLVSAKQLQNFNEALKNIPEVARAFYPKRFGRIIVQFAICAYPLSNDPGVSKQAGFKYPKWYQPRFRCSFHKLS
ncbi:hypothetical protein DFH08DRAFT_823004 [Mycena albidolilacea]|uniref:Uncharacterized protein n=1 Tax=Mycena albidolilacea TaxID=1033008 RepID=A0AAD6Z6W2_9AGAR|nr:hypothetical protein DFH08DRAFT_823004 [Mycena albidolilacea]